MKHLVTMIATGLYSGYIKPFPGTWGTIPAWLIAFFLIKDNPLILAIATVAAFALSVWSAGEAEKLFGHDARKIVMDEWAGMFVSLLFVPFSLLNYGIAFVAFRAFDVIKLPPAAQFERLPRGWGVTMDDIAAGVYANLLTQMIIWASARYGMP
ncbi:MAG: phosphatidylglycerophosphatase A [Candidatus Zixiibacteriota bacterium]